MGRITVRITAKAGELLDPRRVDAREPIFEQLNQTLRGWAQYFRRGHVSAAYRAVNAHVEERVGTF
ncbi:MAG TPA: group II intron maturase-specific domain-containing protein [Bryobacteraceae bacterium]